MNRTMNTLNKLKNNYWLIAILVLGSLLRFYHLDFQSPWLDEIHTLNESNPNTPFSELYNTIMAAEQMPPLYFYLLYFFFKVFGYSTLVARLFSAILGVLSIFSLYKFSKEFVNKKTAIVASFLLAINVFHLYYSQDARPYILLFLFTILSFYGLIKFLKDNSFKKAILFGVYTGLMISTHFFGLFVLFSQLFILLFFLIIIEKNKRINFFKFSFLSGIIAIILFLPAIKIFINVSEIKEFWIQPPAIDAYTLIFKEFFGNSEMILAFIGVFILFYFLRLSKEKQARINYSEIINNRLIFSFIILLPWISIVLLVPLIRSYTTVPMIVSRYYIVVLPAVLILISVGINKFKNNLVQFGLLFILFVFSISDIVFVKKYYIQPNKSQFREASAFVKSNTKSNEIIYSSLPWYFNYFFNEPKIIDKPFNSIISETKNDTTLLAPFWYINSHGNKFEISKENAQFFNDNYVVDKNFEGYDAWAKRFTPKKLIKNDIKIDKFKPFSKPNYGNKIKAWIEKFDIQNDSIKIVGWSFLEKIDSKNSDIYLVFLNDNQNKIVLTTLINRPDITATENCDIDYNNSGFDLKLLKKELNKGVYRLGIYIKNEKKEGLLITDKVVDIK